MILDFNCHIDILTTKYHTVIILQVWTELNVNWNQDINLFLGGSTSLDCFHPHLSRASLAHTDPTRRTRFSLHLAVLSILGVASLLLWWSTCCIAAWLRVLPIDIFDFLIAFTIFVIPVCRRIQVFCFRSQSVMPNIIRSVFLCATASASSESKGKGKGAGSGI